MIRRVREWWCTAFHSHHTCWPIRGTYSCRRCGLQWFVLWKELK